MRDDGASWKAQVQAGLAARRRVNACVKNLGASPDWHRAHTTFAAFFGTMRELRYKAQVESNWLRQLPEQLRMDVFASKYWLKIMRESKINFIVDLWLNWNQIKSVIRYSSNPSNVHERLLELYADTAFDARQMGDQIGAFNYAKTGIIQGEEFISHGETDSRVHAWLLELYNAAGVYAAELGEYVKVFNYYQIGISHGEKFIANEEPSPQVCIGLLRLYGNFGFYANSQGNYNLALHYEQAGIIYGEKFIVHDETNPELRQILLKAYNNIGDSSNNLFRYGEKLFFLLLLDFHRWVWPEESKRFPLQYNYSNDLINFLPVYWSAFLYHLLTECQYIVNQGINSNTLNLAIELIEALLLKSSAQDNYQFCKHFEKWITLQEQIVDKLDIWKDRLKKHYQQLEQAISQLFSEDQPELENLHSRLAELPWRQRLRHPLAYRRTQQDVGAYQKLLDQPVITDDLRSEIQNCQQLFVDWLAERWLDYHEMPGELEKPGLALLGIVFAAHCKDESPETILVRWQAIQPWADPKDLNDAMTRAGWAKVVLPHDDDAFTLHDWTERIGQSRLTVAEATLNFAGPALISTLRAYNQGNPEPLQRALEYAWTQAQEKAPALARLLRRLSSAQETAESFAGSEPPPKEQEVQTALAALVLGDTRAVLAKALHDRLDQQWPLKEDTPLEEAQLCLKRRFSTLVSLSPGPRHHRELAERLHAWCQQALRRELASPHPDVTEIWDTLEHSRVALLGLKVKAPDPAWEEETARQIHAVLQRTPVVPPQPGQIWPPFQCWLDRLKEAGLLPELPTIADCQHRLRADEALVRLFFDPGSGQLFALWLEPDRALDLRRFGDAAAWPHWRAFDDKTTPELHDRWKQWQATAKYGQQGDAAKPGVLDRWERWLEKEEQPRPFPAVFHKVMFSPAVTTVVDTLQAWCRQTARTRLIILLPAPLAQLPWEVLPPFNSGPITLERAVSLSHWRVTPDPAQQDDRENPEDHPDQPPLGVFFDSRPGSVILGKWQAQRAGTFWNRAVLGTDDGLTAFDILTHLHRHANGHLLLHGEYRQDDPRRSHLQLQSDEHLYAWTASAVGVRGGLLGLAACQANLSGATTQTLLASVGLGPALIASGAAAVIGPLWSCNQWAALAFFHRLFELARQEPQELWSNLIKRAGQDLKQLTRADLLKLFKDNHLAEAEQQFKSFLDNYPELGDPPFGDNPFYWAPFILLGDDRRTDSHGIDSKTC